LLPNNFVGEATAAFAPSGSRAYTSDSVNIPGLCGIFFVGDQLTKVKVMPVQRFLLLLLMMMTMMLIIPVMSRLTSVKVISYRGLMS